MKTTDERAYYWSAQHAREDEAEKLGTDCVLRGRPLPSVSIDVRVSCHTLGDEQAAKIKAIHERAAAEILVALGW